MRDSADGLSFDFGSVILAEYGDDDVLGVQVDLYGGQEASCPTIEVHSPYGLYSSPLAATVDANGNVVEATKALFAYEGDRAHAWVHEDPRIIALLPRLKPGESIFYGPTSNFVRAHADGRVSMYTTDDGTPDGHTIMRAVDPDPMLGGIVDFSPWGSTKLNATGYHVNTIGGAFLDMGGVGGFPAPVGALVGSYAYLQADTIGLTGKAVSLGAGPAYDNVVLATPLAAIVAALATFIEAVGAAIPGGNTAVTAAATAFNLAVAPLLLAMRATSTAAS